MSITDITPPDVESTPPPKENAEHNRQRNGLYLLVMRLHFYAGVFVAPFILIAAVTGALYAISPTLESITSHDLLKVEANGQVRPLSEQVTAAVITQPNLALVGVAPASAADDTTRVLFNDPALGESERRAVFVNPYTALPVGTDVVYGSSGALPLRTWIDKLHRDLHLGEPGRIYSELAASWLWVIALAGLVLWIHRVRNRRKRNSAVWLLAPDRTQQGRGRSMNWHGAVGIWILPVILLLSATGMSWSAYAGANITDLRQQLSWTTPTVSIALPGVTAPEHVAGDHHDSDHHMPAPIDPKDRIAQLDRVHEVARANGVTQGSEIAIPAEPGLAFAVKERRMPGVYTVDAVAVDGTTGTITDELAYADWPLMAKLTNWGIQFHMGLMFGLLNQLLLLAAVIGLSAVLVLGYLMWWKRRPTRPGSRFAFGRAPRRGTLRRILPWPAAPIAAAALVVGWFVPLVGLSVLAFLAIDLVVGLIGHRRVTGL